MARSDLIAPGAGAVVMGTGIVSAALAADGVRTLSHVLLVIAVLAWIVLALVAAHRLLFARPRFLLEARSPAGLTGVAGTAVLGSCFLQLGWGEVSIALLIIALVAWPVLVGAALRHLSTHGSGQVFMVTVATEALGSLLATESLAHHAAWLAYPAATLVAAGLAAYPFLLTRFRLGDLARGLGDQWVAGGSLAISSLATAQLARAARSFGAGAQAASAIGDLALVLWIISALWIAPLVLTEVVWPRLSYHSQRWATVFPLGMYAASGFTVAGVADARTLTEFSEAWLWVATAGWCVVAGATAYRGWGVWWAVRLGHG